MLFQTGLCYHHVHTARDHPQQLFSYERTRFDVNAYTCCFISHWPTLVVSALGSCESASSIVPGRLTWDLRKVFPTGICMSGTRPSIFTSCHSRYCMMASA